jgi:hypothetical protein
MIWIMVASTTLTLPLDIHRDQGTQQLGQVQHISKQLFLLGIFGKAFVNVQAIKNTNALKQI